MLFYEEAKMRQGQTGINPLYFSTISLFTNGVHGHHQLIL